MIEFDSIEAQRRTGGKLVLACVGAMVALVPAAGAVTGNRAFLATAIAGGLAVLALIAYRLWSDRFAQRLIAGSALIAQVGLFVLTFRSSPLQAEARLAFLAAMALLVAYSDWRIIAFAAAEVAVIDIAGAVLAPRSLVSGEGLLPLAFAVGVTMATAWSLIWMTAGVSRLFVTVSARTSNAEQAARQADEARTAVIAERAAREQSEAERAAMKATMEAEQALVVNELDAAITKLAGGDLTWRLVRTFAPRYEGLRDNFNQALTRLQAAMSEVVSHASSMSAGVNEMSRASDELARRTEHQAASLVQTATALGQVTVAVNETARNAQRANAAAEGARLEAEGSDAVVTEAVQAMNEIETSSGQIGQIISVIDEIAFQTNLLALNAGVEAARAGDSGKGFAVVAQEVRALAQRSAQAAKEIKTLVEVSGVQVAAGVESVARTSEALQRIVARVAEIDGQVDAIARSAQDQAQSLLEVNATVGEMDRVVQQNAAMVEESTAAAHALRSEASDLADRIGKFRIVGDEAELIQKRA
ncbi:methyl-accepting chemotaxis protein [Caulobacter sp. 1776]|uniref:methyl-accepting chemotaxis protein n=1 Tax=Caulobacter sp. 1776 TaxID=3156420 RepID=UPI003396CF6F